jgi:tetratricopeptide (TPR) repeat protein
MLKPNAAFFFWVWLALFCSYGFNRGDVLPSLARFSRRVMMIFAVVALVGFFLSMRIAMSLLTLRNGHEAAKAGVFDLAERAYQRAHELDPLDPQVLTAQGNLYLRAFRSTSQSVWLDAAQASFLQSVDRAPNYHYNYLALASIYNSRGDHLKANSMTARARTVSPYETERDLGALSRPK